MGRGRSTIMKVFVLKKNNGIDMTFWGLYIMLSRQGVCRVARGHTEILIFARLLTGLIQIK